MMMHEEPAGRMFDLDCAEAEARNRAWLRERIERAFSAPAPSSKAKRQPRTNDRDTPTVVFNRTPDQRITPAEIKARGKAIYARLDSGMLAKEVAAAEGISVNAIYNRLHQAGMNVPPRKCVDCHEPTNKPANA